MVSFGIVAVDKERNSDLAKVLPVEKISVASGEKESVVVNGKGQVDRKTDGSSKLISSQTVEYDVTTVDHQGVSAQNTVKGDMMVVAKWVGGGSNRMTSPDLIKGETVQLYQNSDTGDYYWETFMREPAIRRQETVCYMFGNLPKGVKAFDKNTAYWFEVSTHDKYVKLHTSNNDGEPYTYDLLIDTRNGSVQLSDDVGNLIQLDSSRNKITATALDDIELNTKRVVINASESFTVNTQTATVNASGDYTLNTGSCSNNVSGSISNNTPTTSDSGNVMTSGNLSVGGGISGGVGGGGGGMTIHGQIRGDSTAEFESVTVQGNITAAGNISGAAIYGFLVEDKT